MELLVVFNPGKALPVMLGLRERAKEPGTGNDQTTGGTGGDPLTVGILHLGNSLVANEQHAKRVGLTAQTITLGLG